MNVKLLKSTMALNNDNNKTLAKKLNITPSAISYKMNGKNKFNTKQMNFIRKEYNLSEVEFVEIFIKE